MNDLRKYINIINESMSDKKPFEIVVYSANGEQRVKHFRTAKQAASYFDAVIQSKDEDTYFIEGGEVEIIGVDFDDGSMVEANKARQLEKYLPDYEIDWGRYTNLGF